MELEPFVKAHKLKIEEQDMYMYLWWREYGISAFAYAIDHCMNGKTAKSKYAEELVTQVIEKQKPQIMTEEEILKQREEFIMQRKIAKMNWDLSRKNQKK